jgi:hypothetical protein
MDERILVTFVIEKQEGFEIHLRMISQGRVSDYTPEVLEVIHGGGYTNDIHVLTIDGNQVPYLGKIGMYPITTIFFDKQQKENATKRDRYARIEHDYHFSLFH